MGKHVVYRHTTPSGKVYIGQTNNISKRWFPSSYKHCVFFYNAIKKYGWNNIKHEILFSNLTKEEANSLEIKYIQYYKSLNISYNITEGGEGRLGNIPWNKNKKGVMPPTWNKGKSWSKETRDKISKSKKGVKLGKQSEEHINKRIIKKKIPILQYDIDSEFVFRWPSAKDIETHHFLHHNRKTICACCKEKCLSIDGYIYIYEKDYSKEYLKYRINRYLKGMKYHQKTPKDINVNCPNNLVEWINKL